MPRKKTTDYDNTSITTLKGADRVRKRPAVIFGSDGIDGCQHSVFEILSNSIDEAREGYGKKITVTRYSDGSIEVEDHGRGIPVDYNENEKRYNWELVFCELYAGGKYNNNEGESYEFSLGMNGLGLCSTQYSSEYMDVDIRRDGYRYTLRFEKGEIVGKLKKEPYSKKDTGTKIHWKPDLEVFTDIDIQPEYFLDIMKRQAIVALLYPSRCWSRESFITPAISAESIISCFPTLRASLSKVRTLPMVRFMGAWYPL